jgi:hypothetical protein
MKVKDTKSYLLMIRKMHIKMRNKKKPKEWAYYSIEDFILKNGKQMKEGVLPKGVKRGKMMDCFKNAFELAQEKGYSYCEGYAFSMLHTNHAWCLHDGKVVDPTWTDGVDYFGVEFPMNTVRKIILKSEHYGILDTPQIGFPLLTGEITLEDD